MAEAVRERLSKALFRPFVPLGLGEHDAAESIGISSSKFRQLVDDGRMPKPRKIDGRRVWDVDELRAAFKSLPRDGGEAVEDSWEDF